MEAWRSDPDRHVDGTSDQRLSAVSADQQRNGFHILPVNLLVWTAFPFVVPSQTVASPGVLQGDDSQTPSECGRRRGPSIETPTPIRDRGVSGRLVICARDLDRFRTSY